MKTVRVDFIHISRTEQGRPATTSSTVVCEDDVDGYEVMTHFEGAVLFGWVVSKMTTLEEGVRIYREVSASGHGY